MTELGTLSLEERRHQKDMCPVHKIMCKKSFLGPETWFTGVEQSAGGHATRSKNDPLKIRIRTGRLGVQMNFLSIRVMTDWNTICRGASPQRRSQIQGCLQDNLRPNEVWLNGHGRQSQMRAERVQSQMMVSPVPHLGPGGPVFKYTSNYTGFYIQFFTLCYKTLQDSFGRPT
jgi:hypothetical protein